MCFQDPSYFCGIWALHVSWFICYKKQSLPPTPSQIIQILWMETYTEFGDSYLIQTFVNKINTKLWNYCQVIPPPLQPWISNFQKEHFTFNERTNGFTPPSTSGLGMPLLVIKYICIYIYISIYLYICIYIMCDIYIYIYITYNFCYIILN